MSSDSPFHAFCDTTAEGLLYGRLVAQKEPVLFLGESTNRSLPVSFAVIRGSFGGVWATSKELLSKKIVRDNDYLSRARTICLKNVRWLKQHFPSRTEQLDLRDQANDDAAFPSRLNLRADATSLTSFFKVYPSAPRRNIWFQCPFISFGPPTAQLLSDTLRCVSSLQSEGDAFFLGLITRADIFQCYDIPRVLSNAQALGYTVIRIDNTFIQKCIQLEYVHETMSKTNKLHPQVLGQHVTYVFLKGSFHPSIIHSMPVVPASMNAITSATQEEDPVSLFRREEKRRKRREQRRRRRERKEKKRLEDERKAKKAIAKKAEKKEAAKIAVRKAVEDKKKPKREQGSKRRAKGSKKPKMGSLLGCLFSVRS